MADLEALRTFVAAARLGSFAAAARQLNLSPAMVGRRISGLEDQYRLRLIERTTRSQHLTEQGRHFLEQAQAVLDAAEALHEFGGEDGPLRGRIRLSAPTTLGSARLPAMIAAFTTAHPEVIVEMSLSNRRVDLVGDGYDLAVRVGELSNSGLVARRIGTYRFICCASPDFLHRHGPLAHPRQLEGARCVLNLNVKPRNRWRFTGPDGGPLSVEVAGAVETDGDQAQRLLAIAGAGVAYLPDDLVADDVAAGRLVGLFGNWTLPTMPIHTVHASRHLVPRRLSRFIAALADGFREDDRGGESGFTATTQ